MPTNEITPDHELVEKMQKDDLIAFDQIFNRYSNRLFGFALKFLKSKEETEGLVQDVFLKIWENRKEIKKESSLKSYLFTIAYHDICRIFRAKQNSLKFIHANEKTKNKFVDMEEQMGYKSILEQIDELIDKLPDKQKQIFLKSRREYKSTREIAKEMNLSPGTINNNISATIKFLKTHLSGEEIAILLFFAVFIQ